MGDESALQMLQEYSKACARFAHEPSQANALAMDAKRQAMQSHFAQREHAIGSAINRLVTAALAHSEGDQSLVEERETELRAIIGLS